jgi:hypothetical protein
MNALWGRFPSFSFGCCGSLQNPLELTIISFLSCLVKTTLAGWKAEPKKMKKKKEKLKK